jgi:hypothetical protein
LASFVGGSISWTVTWYRPEGKVKIDELTEMVWEMALMSNSFAQAQLKDLLQSNKPTKKVFIYINLGHTLLQILNNTYNKNIVILSA